MFSPARTPLVDGVSEKDIKNNATGHTLCANIYYPTENNGGLPVYLYFHAGGFMVGSPELLETAARELVKKHNMVVITPSYRLAPENPFPAAVHDVWAWTQWVAHHGTELGVGADPSKAYILAGESVGGNMAFVCCIEGQRSS
jgi:acetyl esterase